MPPTTARRPARSAFSDELRDAIDRDGRTPHAIARAAGIDPAILSRFLAGHRGITSDTLDRLAPELGLHLAGGTRARGRPKGPNRAGIKRAATAGTVMGCGEDSALESGESNANSNAP